MRWSFSRRSFGKRRRKKQMRRILLLFLAVFPVLILAERNLPKLPPEVRTTALRSFTQTKISNTVSDFLQEDPVFSGNSLLTIDTYRLREAQAALTADLQKNLTGRTVLWIPLGSLTDIALLNGRGPKIPVVFSTICAADLTLQSTMVSAGINRTQVRILLKITAEVCSLSSSFPESVSVQVSYPVYESVLEGDVPQIASVLR